MADYISTRSNDSGQEIFSKKKYFDGVFITRVAVCVCLCACVRVRRGMILTCPVYFENKNIILPGKRNAVTERKKYLVD